MEPNPFFEPDFLTLASRAFDGFSKTRLLVASEGSEFRGVLPIIGVERTRIPPRLTMTTRGYPTMVSSLCTPLVDRTCVDRTIGALLDGLRNGAKRGELPGILSLKRIGENGPVIESLRREAGARGMPTFTKESWVRGMVNRTGRWESPVSGQRRRENARRRRVLARDSGRELSVVDRTLDPAAASEFLKMEASGWKGRDEGTAYARDPAKVAWFHEWTDRWTKAGRLKVLSLNVGNTSIAIQYYLRAGEGLFLFRIAYDDSYAKYGPGGLLLESGMAIQLEQTDASWIDSSTDPDNAFLLEMLPERRTISMLLIGTGGTLDRTLVSAMPVMTRGVAELHRARQWSKQLGRSRSSAGQSG